MCIRLVSYRKDSLTTFITLTITTKPEIKTNTSNLSVYQTLDDWTKFTRGTHIHTCSLCKYFSSEHTMFIDMHISVSTNYSSGYTSPSVCLINTMTIYKITAYRNVALF